MNVRRWMRYASATLAIALALVAVALGGFQVEGARRAAILLAVGVAVPVQWLGFAILLRYRDRPNGFLGAWLAGSGLRLAGVGIVAGAVFANREALDPLAALIGVAGLFFVLHLLEPWGLGKRGPDRKLDANTDDL